MNVRLYCDRHDRVHELPARAVERLVYGLQFTAVTAYRGSAAQRPEDEQSATARVLCPLDALLPAGAPEGFVEHVDAWVGARRSACTACEGTGDNPHPYRMVDDGVEQDDDCGRCEGSGVEPERNDNCGRCEGSGIESEQNDDCRRCEGSGIEPKQAPDAADPRSVDSAENSTNTPNGGGR